MASLPSFAPWLLFAWLSFEMLWDLRDRRVPTWFSIGMLVPGVILLARESSWVAVLIVASILSSEVYHHSPAAGIPGMALPMLLVWVIHPGSLPLALGWGALATLWVLKVVGGADALAGLSLLLFHPSWGMFLCILAGILTWFGIFLLWRYRGRTGIRLWAVASTGARGVRVPGIGAYAVAMLIYGMVGGRL